MTAPVINAAPEEAQVKTERTVWRRRSTDFQDHRPEPKRGLRSTFIVSVAVFLSCNLLLSFFSALHFDPYNFPYRGWAWWIFDDLRQHPDSHNVALLGSSLMVSAVSGTDANHLNKPLDLTAYHKASYLDHALSKTFGGSFNSFNLSMPGQMPSDAYMALRAMVNTADRPDVVIYGVAPRDFIDSTMSDPLRTEPFEYLSRLVNVDDVKGGLYRNPLTRLEYWLQKHVYLYEYSLDLQMSTRKWTERFIANYMPPPPSDKRFTWWDRVKLVPSYLPMEIRPAAVISAPMDKQTAASRFSDNTNEYIQRYKRPDPGIYKTQFYFLRHLAAFCHREKIDLVLVNMPITPDNVKLLKPSWYWSYVQALREFSFNNSVPAFDLSEFDHYQKSDFHDPVHLNAFGGTKFFDRLATILKGNRRTKTALIMAGKNLETRQSLAAQEIRENDQAAAEQKAAQMHEAPKAIAGKGAGM